MKFYISARGIKRVTISSSVAVEDGGGGGGFGEVMKGKKSSVPGGGTRRMYHRVVLPIALIFALFLPFLFVRIAFLVLESASFCSSSPGK